VAHAAVLEAHGKPFANPADGAPALYKARRARAGARRRAAR
jgi:hypothetical protein